MQIAAVTEIVTHFVGSLHVYVDPERDWSRPDGAPRLQAEGYAPAPTGHAMAKPEAPLPAPTAIEATPGEPASQDPHFTRWSGHAHPAPPITPTHIAFFPNLAPPDENPFTGMIVGGGASAAAQGATSPVWNGPDQAIVDDHQANMLIGDASYVDHANGPLPIASDANVEPLIQESYAATPTTAPQLGMSDSQELPVLKVYEDGLASGTTPTQSTLQQGTTVDGTLVSHDGTPLQANLPITTFDTSVASGTNVPFGQTVVLGQDTAANAAVIVDTSAAPLTTIVEGNAYSANLIVQTNVVQNHDALATSGPPSLAALLGADSVHNTATFAELPNVVQGTVTGALGQTLSVNVVNGDFYDVNASTQQNVLLNNTLYVGTPSVDHYYAVLGGDGQENAVTITQDGPSYDVLVVLGSSYQVNAIYQDNVLSSNNTVGAAFSPANGGTDTLSAGGDTVANQASIETIGAQAWQAAGGSIQAFVKDLLSEGDAAKLIPGLPAFGAHVAVTVVTGDYYLLNLVSQTDVVANSATALVDLTQASGGAPAKVITGVDTLQNAAAIVAAHALDTQYVAGKAYETAMLVQTNLVDAHGSTSAAPPASLLPYLVGFLDPGHAADVGAALAASAPAQAAHDTHHPLLA